MNVGYVRVSISSQSLENQIEQLKAAGCEKIFSEKRSWKNETDREQFKIMKNFIRGGYVLFVTKLDRLARSVIDLHEFAKFLEEKDVGLKVLHQSIDTTSPAARAKGVKFGRKAILSSKEKNVIYKQHEKGKSVIWLSSFFHVARNTIYRALKEIAQKK